MEDCSFGAKVVAMREHLDDPAYFQHIKERLVLECGRFLIPQMMDSGKHHVIKLDMYRDDNPSRPPYEVVFYLKGRHSIAREQHVIMPVMDDFVLPITAKPCCQWCGNELRLDRRGGCSACGGWPKGEYENAIRQVENARR